MKTLLKLCLIGIMVLSVSACGSKTEKSSTETTPKASSSIAATQDEKKDNQNTGNIQVVIGNEERLKWPKDILSPDMPEYTKGTFGSWMYADNTTTNDIYMLIQNTSQADLDAYIEEMKSSGFELTNGKTYHKDLFDVSFQFNSDTILQITSYKTDVKDWPESLAAIPPIETGDLDNIDGPSDEYVDSVTLYFINTSKDNLDAWGEKLAANGYTFKDGLITGQNIKLNGKSYASVEIWYEENGGNEWFVYFQFKE